MNKLNILVTAVGGDIGANILNILLEQKNIKLFIVGTDINENIFAIDKVNKFYQVHKANHLDYKKQIVKIVKENSIDAIIPVSEQEIIWFNNNRNIFNALNIKLLINNSNIVDSFLNKLETSRALEDISIKTPKTFLFSNFINQIEFPLILKSKYSVLTKDIYIIKNESQLELLKKSIEKPDDYIIQQYVGSIDDEYTTTVYRSNNRLEVINFKRKLTGGMTSFATIANEKVLYDYAKNIAESFNLNGCINIQSRKSAKEFYIFEINPRFSSTVFIRNHFGFQDVLWWLNDIFDKDIINLKQTEIKSNGSAVLGYQYKFFDQEEI